MPNALAVTIMVLATAWVPPALAQHIHLPFNRDPSIVQDQPPALAADNVETMRKWEALSLTTQVHLVNRMRSLPADGRRVLLVEALGVSHLSAQELDGLAARVTEHVNANVPMKVSLDRIDPRPPRVAAESTTSLAIRTEWVSGISAGPDYRAMQFYEHAAGKLRHLPIARCTPIPRPGDAQALLTHTCYQSLPILTANPTVYVEMPFHTRDGVLTIQSAPLTISTAP